MPFRSLLDISLSIPLYPSLCLSPSLLLSLSLYNPMYPILSLNPSLSLYISLSTPFSLHIPPSLSLPLSLSLSLSIPLYHILSQNPPLSFSLRRFLYVGMPVYIYYNSPNMRKKLLANCGSQFLLNRLRRCQKLFVWNVCTSYHEFASQFGLEMFLCGK